MKSQSDRVMQGEIASLSEMEFRSDSTYNLATASQPRKKGKILWLAVQNTMLPFDKLYAYFFMDEKFSGEPLERVSHKKEGVLFSEKVKRFVGHFVEVPFGKNNLIKKALVLAEDEEIYSLLSQEEREKFTYPDISQIKPIEKVLDQRIHLQEEDIQVLKWFRTRYHCSWSKVCQLFYPSNLYLYQSKIKNDKFYQWNLAHKEEIEAFLATSSLNKQRQREILMFLKSHSSSFSEMKEAGLSLSSLKALEKKAWLSCEIGYTFFTKEKSSIDKSIDFTAHEKGNLSTYPFQLKLNTEQNQALQTLITLSKEKKYQEVLLHGVTGSGKTELYLRMVYEMQQRGKTVILLVPEISLTPMMIKRFTQYFSTTIAVLHSALTPKQRAEEWKKIIEGRATLVLGARSAIFAPLPNLGLVIVDEEHEASYISSQHPYYDAKTVARLRLHKEGLLLLGSATPSLNSYHRVEQGKSFYLQLKHRAKEAELPQVKVENLAQPFLKEEEKQSYFLRPSLIRSLHQCFEEKKQALLLVNRRGFSPQLVCKHCLETLYCPHCSVPLTYHKRGEKMLCHYCGYAQIRPKLCPFCHEGKLVERGLGIQQIEEDLQKIFPDKTILRMDQDSLNRENSHAKILKRFEEEKVDILLGTQMIAKGHDYESVGFVAVLGIDQLLYMNEYDAGEKAFQLLTQAAGRTGRGKDKGKVIFYTSFPEHHSVLAACQQDFHFFAKKELPLRKNAGFPPYQYLLRLQILAPQEAQAETYAENMYKQLKNKQAPQATWKIFPPFPAEVFKVQRQYRFEILIKGGDLRHIAKMRDFIENIKHPKKHYVYCRIEPS